MLLCRLFNIVKNISLFLVEIFNVKSYMCKTMDILYVWKNIDYVIDG